MLKEKADLLEALGTSTAATVRKFVEESPYKAKLQIDETVLSHVRTVALQYFDKSQSASALVLFEEFPAAIDNTVRREACELMLAEMRRSTRATSTWTEAESRRFEDTFGLLHDSKFLEGLVPIITDYIRAKHYAKVNGMLLRYDVPTNDENLQAWAKIGANAALLEGKIMPEGFLKKFPELLKDDEIRSSMKLFARKILARDAIRGPGYNEVVKYMPELAKDPEIREALKLRAARKGGNPYSNDPDASGMEASDKRDAEAVAFLDKLLEHPFHDDDYMRAKFRRFHGYPHAREILKSAICRTWVKVSLETAVELIDTYPEWAGDPDIEKVAKMTLLRSLEIPKRYHGVPIEDFKFTLRLLSHFPRLLKEPEVQDILKRP